MLKNTLWLKKSDYRGNGGNLRMEEEQIQLINILVNIIAYFYSLKFLNEHTSEIQQFQFQNIAIK